MTTVDRRSLWARFRLQGALRRSRVELLAALQGAGSVTFIRSWGNIGDELIYAGTRQLLAGVPHAEVSVRDVDEVEGELGVLSGGGAWCEPFHEVLPAALPRIEERFERVVVFPSSFDPRVEAVREALRATRSRVFAREPEFYTLIRGLCDAELAHDCAFFFDYHPYRRPGSGLLLAFRTDAESTLDRLPEGNLDISVTCANLDEWLRTIAAHEEVHTDRAHVMLAAAMLGKRVRYRSSAGALAHMTWRARAVRGSTSAQELVEGGEIAFVEIDYPPKHVARAADTIEISKGNHAVSGVPGPIEETAALVCLHAPLRSGAVLAAKAATASRVHEEDPDPGIAWQTKRWGRLAAEGRLDEEWAANSQAHGTLDVRGTSGR